jgi:8-oxo-dGTP pyrophosphatase MutT (NUDIX family)
MIVRLLRLGFIFFGGSIVPIRNSSKAILIQENRVLVSKCRGKTGGIYYDLPGGGQNQYETMEEAVVRECLEETGFLVKPVRLAAIAEEIYLDEMLRSLYPDTTHKLFHVFLCDLKDCVKRDITQPDSDHIEHYWLPTGEIAALPLRPYKIAPRFEEIRFAKAPVYLGVEYL